MQRDKTGKEMILISKSIAETALNNSRNRSQEAVKTLTTAADMSSFGLPIALLVAALAGTALAIRVAKKFNLPIRSAIAELEDGSLNLNNTAQQISGSQGPRHRCKQSSIEP